MHRPSFRAVADAVPAYGRFEIVAEIGRPVEDAFRRLNLTLTVGETTVAGFVDAADGSVMRARFLPKTPGRYEWTATLTDDVGAVTTASGAFEVLPSDSKGLLKTDGWGFRWENGERFVWNSTTCYLMAGLSEDRIVEALDRLARLGVNRIRVSLCPSRQTDGQRWYEPQVKPREDFAYLYGPWPAARPDSQSDPGFDVTRFDTAYWRKYERLLALADERDIVVQVVFFTDAQEPYNYPFDRARIGTDPDEHRYYAYGVARLAAFRNVEWCVTNEWALFRPDEWADVIGPRIAAADPYGHLLSVHGHERFPYRTSGWATHALFQMWDEHGGYDVMRRMRDEQAATGRPIPQVNEEYGYEDHYPGPWGGARKHPARIAANRVALAWEIVFAGGWPTTGESAASGAGGWITGLGTDDEMLLGHLELRRFVESLPDVALTPRTHSESPRIWALDGPDRAAVAYLLPDGPEGAPEGTRVAVPGGGVAVRA